MKDCMKMIMNKRTQPLSSIERTLARSRLQRMKKIKVMKERRQKQQRLGERNKGQRAKNKAQKRRGKGQGRRKKKKKKKKRNKGQRSGQNILTKKVQNRPRRLRNGSPATRRRPHQQQPPVMRNRNAAAKFRSGRRPKRNYHQQKAMYKGQHPIDYVLDSLTGWMWSYDGKSSNVICKVSISKYQYHVPNGVGVKLVLIDRSRQKV